MKDQQLRRHLISKGYLQVGPYLLSLAAFDSSGLCVIDTKVINRENTRNPSNIKRRSMYFRKEATRDLEVSSFINPVDEEMESLCLSSFLSQSSDDLDAAAIAGE